MTTILFRTYDKQTKLEEEIAKKYFYTINSRVLVNSGELVIPRYSAYPFEKEMEIDVKNLGGRLINSYREHVYVANLQNWYQDLIEYTPETWFSLQDVPDDGPFVLKGETKSRKEKFKQLMFANNKKEAIEVFIKLQDDGFLNGQEIYVRKFEEFNTYFTDEITGIPITEEYRFFVLDKKIMCGGYYWSSHVDSFEKIPSPDNVPREFLETIIGLVGNNIRFFVVDVARRKDGVWRVVELNDGCAAGLSECNPDELYSNLKTELE